MRSNEELKRYKILVIAPTCFYYQTGLFQTLTNHSGFDLRVNFCSDEALLAKDVQEMYKVNSNWGEEDELLLGYKYKFLKNYSLNPSYLKWPCGLMNFGVWNEIKRNRPDMIILMSWMNVTWWTAMLAGSLYRIPILFLTDANIQGDLRGPIWKRILKSLFLGQCIFKLASGFLCAGTANRELYQHYKVPEHKLIPFAYSWGYERLLSIAPALISNKINLRAKMGIPKDKRVILYAGRLSSEKSPMHLLEAYERVHADNTYLIFAGDGEMRGEMERYVSEKGLHSVHFAGFQNRQDILEFYAVSDMLVLPSRKETWGMVINEALAFGLPAIASDQVGAARDLIVHGENGYLFKFGHVAELSDYLSKLINLDNASLSRMSLTSTDIINSWINRDLCNSFYEYIDATNRRSD